MEEILQALHEVEGVQASLVVSATGQLMGRRAPALYDAALLDEVARTVVNAVDALQLVHEDWEVITASFADGTILVRNLGASRTAAAPTVLAVVADGRLNPSFAGIAMRVAASRLRGAFQGPAPAAAVPARPVAPPAPPRRPELSVVGPTPPPVRTPLPVPAPRMDGASAALLSGCTRALAASVGPMARVFVNEAVARVCGGQPFSAEHALRLVAELEGHIDDPVERAQFRQAANPVGSNEGRERR